MDSLPEIFDNNRRWAAERVAEDPEFFARLVHQQAPRYLWIGCSDSRVPANQICGLQPGEIFVHRNVANLVIHTDFNLLAVIQFAVDVLHVRHLIVCGHYGCGGVKAALDNSRHGIIDNWLRHIQFVARSHVAELEPLAPAQRTDRLCELNVIAQSENLAQTTIIQDAWARGQPLDIHSWIYRLSDGRLRSLAPALTGETGPGSVNNP